MMDKRLKIGFDYDETFTEDEPMWAAIIKMMRAVGHEVKFVTWRKPDGDNSDIEHSAARLGIPIVFCSGKAKMKCYAADIWIDDSPYAVVCHAKWANFKDD
jgi:hypothetical protein